MVASMRTLVLVLLALPSFAELAKVQLPKPDLTPKPGNAARIVPQPADAKLSVPEGFTVEEYASGLNKPRIMVTAPGGEILVTESVPNGNVVVLKDGKKVKNLIEKLDKPYGMAWWKGYLYVAEPTSVKRYRYDAKTVSVAAGEEVLPLPGMTAGHWTRSLAFDPKTGKMYVGIGSSHNHEFNPSDPELRASIAECEPDGKNCHVYASGLRNPTTINFYPGSGQLWTTVQERDGLGDDLVPDFFTHVQKGGFYGWPWAYFGSNEDPRNAGKKPEMVAKSITPDISLGAHVAVIDWKFYTGKQFPAKYRNGAFFAFRGSSGKSDRVGYGVTFIPFKNGKPLASEPQPFLSGFTIAGNPKDVWGRPTGVMVAQDGSLLMSEDGNNKIWRISYKH